MSLFKADKISGVSVPDTGPKIVIEKMEVLISIIILCVLMQVPKKSALII